MSAQWVCPSSYDFHQAIETPILLSQEKGHRSIIYIDDAYLQGDSYDACYNNVYETLSLFQKLGFTINPSEVCVAPNSESCIPRICPGFSPNDHYIVSTVDRGNYLCMYYVAPGTFSSNMTCCICPWYVDCSLTCCPAWGTLL